MDKDHPVDRRQFLIFGTVLPILAACEANAGIGKGGRTAAATRFTGGADGRFLLDGKPFVMAAGEVHPQRIPHEYWDHRIKMVKAMGFNTISIYDFWSEHVVGHNGAINAPIYDFTTGRNGLGAFLDLCRSNNMWVFLRPGPFVDAYWDLGGIPGYLLATDGIRLRSSRDPVYMAAVESYIAAIAPLVTSRLSGNGGPIVMVQVENEYTSFGSDTAYLPAVKALWERYGVGGAANGHNVLLSTNNGINEDGSVFSPAAALLDLPIGGDPLEIGANPDSTDMFDRAFARYRQPIFSAETYSGWDTLGSSPAMYPENDNVDGIGATVDYFLRKGVSFAVYVGPGGTSFGYGAAGNYDIKTRLFDPNVTSYDYRAPINEQGSTAYNRKDADGELSLSTFDDIRAAFGAALAAGGRRDGAGYTIPYSRPGPLDRSSTAARAQTGLPGAPAPLPMIALPRDRVTLTPVATIWDNLPPPIRSTVGPKACESVGMYSGCGIVYATRTPPLFGKHDFTLASVADVATVFVDGQLAAVIDRRVKQGPLTGDVRLGAQSADGARRSVVELDFGPARRESAIEIFVYTFGHAHKEFTGVAGDAFRKGIWGDAFLTPRSPPASSDRVNLADWAIHPLPMRSPGWLETLKPIAAGWKPRAGMFYSATFELDAIGDCYLDVSSWTLGVAWVNGHNIGRHFAASSPQKMLFCPAPYLRKGANRILIFDAMITDTTEAFIELSNIQSTYSPDA